MSHCSSVNLSASQGLSQAPVARPGVGNRRREAVEALDKALQSGDLAAAQAAFTRLQQAGPTSQASAGPLAKDLPALEQALKSGDLKAAQEAFAVFKEDVQAAHQTRHPHVQGPKGAEGPPPPPPPDSPRVGGPDGDRQRTVDWVV